MSDGGDGFDGCIEVVQRTRGYATTQAATTFASHGTRGSRAAR